MVRTINETPCLACGKTTNYYSQCLGRICPKCLDQFLKDMVKAWDILHGTNYYREEETKLGKEPLIDHSDDIEKYILNKRRKSN